MLISIAWQNVWRNKTRSWVIITAIGLGIWAGIFMLAFSWGMYEQRIDDTIKNEISHLQIHHPEFKEEKGIQFLVMDSKAYEEKIKQNKLITAYSKRIVCTGMIGSAKTSAGIQLIGVDPIAEQQVTGLDKKLIEGKYFESKSKRTPPIVLSEKMAKKLNVKIRSKVILTFQDSNHDIITAAFKVNGIYKSANSVYDLQNVFVPKKSLEKLLKFNTNQYHEIALLLNDGEQIITVQNDLKTIGKSQVETWKELSPDLAYSIDMLNQSMDIFMGIILLALAFGIINTMLMAVLERVREIGMLMAIGMNKTKVFLMIVLETIFLSSVGGILGLLFSYISIYYFQQTGIDLSTFSAGLEQFGMSKVVYPNLEFASYIRTSIQVLIVSFLASIYPAWKALKLNPATAIRKI